MTQPVWFSCRRRPGARCLRCRCGDPLPQTVLEPGPYARLRLARAILYTTRTIPLLYYKDEIAPAGANDPDNRRTFHGGSSRRDSSRELDPSQQTHYELCRRSVNSVRRIPAQRGDRVTTRVDDQLLVYRRRPVAIAFIVVTSVLRPTSSSSPTSQAPSERFWGTRAWHDTDGVRVRVGANDVAIVGTSTP